MYRELIGKYVEVRLVEPISLFYGKRRTFVGVLIHETDTTLTFRVGEWEREDTVDVYTVVVDKSECKSITPCRTDARSLVNGKTWYVREE